MPDANKGPGIPGGKNSKGQPVANVGEQVGAVPSPPTEESTAMGLKKKPTKKDDAWQNISQLIKIDTASTPGDWKSGWTNSEKFNKGKGRLPSGLVAPKRTPQIINVPFPAKVINNSSEVGSLPSGGGDPTPLPNISSTNPLNREDISYNALALGIC